MELSARSSLVPRRPTSSWRGQALESGTNWGRLSAGYPVWDWHLVLVSVVGRGRARRMRRLPRRRWAWRRSPGWPGGAGVGAAAGSLGLPADDLGSAPPADDHGAPARQVPRSAMLRARTSPWRGRRSGTASHHRVLFRSGWSASRKASSSAAGTARARGRARPVGPGAAASRPVAGEVGVQPWRVV